MKRLLLKIFLFFFLQVCIYLAVVSFPTMRYSFTNDTTESDLLAMPKGTSWDIILMGTSHAKIFSRNGNYDRVDQILSKRIFNLAKGGGHGGIFPEQLMLSRFYADGNHADTVVYLVDPWVFYSRQWNEENYFLEDEPFDIRLYFVALWNGVGRSVLINGFQTKLFHRWLLLEPASREPKTDKLLSVNDTQIAQDKKDYYLNGLNQETFLHYTMLFKQLVTLAEENNSRVILIFPTTLWQETPGKNQVLTFFQELQKKHPSVEVHDFSHVITDPQYYYDTNHLNSLGVEYFTRAYLLPLFHIEREKTSH